MLPKMSFSLFIVVLIASIPLINSKPSPQQAVQPGKVQDSRDVDIDTVKEEEKKVENKKDEEDNNDIGQTVSDIFGGVLNLVSGALDTAEELAGNQEIQNSLSSILDAGVKTAAQAAVTGAQVAQTAPAHFEEKGHFISGLTKTVEETGGFLGGSLEELEQGAKLLSVFAQAYGDITLKRIENFSEIFNKRFKCNTDCKKLEDGSAEKKECENKFCEGFVKPKTKKEQKEEELKKLAEQYDYDYSYDEDEEEDS